MTGERDWAERMPGKMSFDHCYSGETPACFFSGFSKHDWMAPDTARPYIAQAAEFCRRRAKDGRVRVVDVGCSFGINSMLLLSRLAYSQIQAWYTSEFYHSLSVEDAMVVDEQLYSLFKNNSKIIVSGMDMASKALHYGKRVGLLQDTLRCDLESPDTPAGLADFCMGTDLIISTGTVGYVTHVTFEKLLREGDTECRPLLALFVSRTFNTDRLVQTLTQHGYHVIHDTRVRLRQRRFASDEEQDAALALVKGIWPLGEIYETDGWVYAHPMIATKNEELTKQFSDFIFGPIDSPSGP